MKITGNEPVNPYYDADDNSIIGVGITIRQEFAKAAMAGLISYSFLSMNAHHIAEQSVKLADALIAELNRTDETK